MKKNKKNHWAEDLLLGNSAGIRILTKLRRNVLSDVPRQTSAFVPSNATDLASDESLPTLVTWRILTCNGGMGHYVFTFNGDDIYSLYGYLERDGGHAVVRKFDVSDDSYERAIGDIAERFENSLLDCSHNRGYLFRFKDCKFQSILQGNNTEWLIFPALKRADGFLDTARPAARNRLDSSGNTNQAATGQVSHALLPTLVGIYSDDATLTMFKDFQLASAVEWPSSNGIYDEWARLTLLYGLDRLYRRRTSERGIYGNPPLAFFPAAGTAYDDGMEYHGLAPYSLT